MSKSRTRRPAQATRPAGASPVVPAGKHLLPLRLHNPRNLAQWRADPKYPGRLGSDYVPDAVLETTRHRRRTALTTGGKFDQITALRRLYGQVSHFVIDVQKIHPGDYYTSATALLGREAALTFLNRRGLHGTWTVRISRSGMLHVHLVTRPGHEVLGIWSRLLDETEPDQLKLAAYMTGPTDEAAWRPDRPALSAVGFDQGIIAAAREAAADRWLEAKDDARQQGRSRLPVMSGHNIPREVMRAVKASRAGVQELVELPDLDTQEPDVHDPAPTPVGVDTGKINPLRVQSVFGGREGGCDPTPPAHCHPRGGPPPGSP